jgi:hypothetical protein
MLHRLWRTWFLVPRDPVNSGKQAVEKLGEKSGRALGHLIWCDWRSILREKTSNYTSCKLYTSLTQSGSKGKTSSDS